MTTTIYLVRHGEVYNPDGIIYGRLPNFGLSDKGKLELEKTAEFLKNRHISQIYASPLLRAQQSAEIIKNIFEIPAIHTSEEIIEVKTSYEGGRFSNLDALQSEVYLKPLSPTDETIVQIAARMQRFVTQLTAKHPHQHIVAISHGDPIMILKTAIQNKELSFHIFKTNTYVQHGEVYEITVDDDKSLSIKSVFIPKI